MINLGNIYSEQGKHENAALMYLQGLEIEQNDDDALCNLALVLQKLNYNDFAKIAYEEGINVNPGNRALIRNYLLFLLEIKELEKFSTVLSHAKRVLDAADLSLIIKLQGEFQKALGVQGTSS